jgi:prepilin-type N-terminal cleavage/methylation domain-containing protein
VKLAALLRDKPLRLAAQGGFSMVELSVCLVIAGLMSWAVFSGYETVTAQQEIERGHAEAQQLQSTLRAFALRQGRLPCPDTSVTGTGYENLVAGECAPGTQVGWFPYVSVGLEIPVDKFRARYSVFRSSNAVVAQDADLAVAKERTGDTAAADSTTLRDATDLIVALNNASVLPASSARTFLTGDAGSAGAIDCATNVLMSAAYWIVVPLQDKDNDIYKSRFDAPHLSVAPFSPCAASPSAPVRLASDDIVVAESPNQLAGWLRRSLP